MHVKDFKKWKRGTYERKYENEYEKNDPFAILCERKLSARASIAIHSNFPAFPDFFLPNGPLLRLV